MSNFHDFPVFKGLNATQIDNFVSGCADEQHADGTELIRQGGSEDRVYLLYEGEVAIEVEANGGAREVARVKAPGVLGEMEFLTCEPRSASVRAVGSVKTLEMTFESLRSRVGDGDPATLKVFYNVATVLARRLAAANEKLAEITVQEPERTADLDAFQQKLFGEWDV